MQSDRQRRVHSALMQSDRQRRVHSALMIIALLLTATLSAVFGFVFNLDRTVNDHLRRVDGAFPAASTRPPPPNDSPRGQPAVTLLVLGADSLPEHATVGGYAVDTILLVHLDEQRTRADVVSLPADTRVTLPGYGTDRLSAATTRGGLPLAVQTVEQLTRNRVDHVAVLDLDGVREVTDVLGGVTVQARQPFSAGGHRFSEGPHTLDGTGAAVFVREQAALPDGTAGRALNQQAYLRGLADNLLSSRTITDPARVRDLLAVTANNLMVDADLTPSRLRALTVSLRSLSPSSVRVTSLRADSAPDGLLNPAPGDLQALRVALTEDDFRRFRP